MPEPKEQLGVDALTDQALLGDDTKPPEPEDGHGDTAPGTSEDGHGEEVSPDVQQILEKTGYESLEKLAEAHSELRKHDTQTSQQNSELRQRISEAELGGATGMPMARGRSAAQEIEPIDDAKVFEQPVESIRQIASTAVQEAILRTEIDRVRNDNPQAFERLRPSMIELSRAYPNASPSALI